MIMCFITISLRVLLCSVIIIIISLDLAPVGTPIGPQMLKKHVEIGLNLVLLNDFDHCELDSGP